MPTVCEGAEGAGAHRVDDHDVPEQRRYRERREEVRCKSIFSNKTRIYFDSLIIAILNIGKNKHCEILVSCSDEERNCMQAQETACKLM